MREDSREVKPETPAAAIHESDLNGIRSAVQWLLGAFGGIALVVVASIQMSGLSNVLSRGGWQAFAVPAGLLLVFVSLTFLARAAARVLVPDRTNLSDLLEDQALDEARQAGLVVSARGDSAKVYGHVRDEINRARGWLLPPGFQDIDTAYQVFRQRSYEDQAPLRISFREIMAFARAEAALYRYNQLLSLLIGRAGPAVLLGLIILAVALSAPTRPDLTAPVTEPYKVDVHFTHDPSLLRDAGLNAGCANTVASGVAIGGSLTEPEVVTTGTALCPAAKVVIAKDIGIAYPLVP